MPWAADSIMAALGAKVIEFFAVTIVSPVMFCPYSILCISNLSSEMGKKIHIST
jgi:hypothetical protein